MALDLKQPPKKKVTTRPHDAATLILVRFDGPVPRILMGQRHAAHAFMPNKFVFPGGRLEAADSRLPVIRDGEPITVDKLKLRMRPKPSQGRARGLLVAAIRETYEETGFLEGRSQRDEPFDLQGLVYFARAITPPGRTRRFDSRFIVADAKLVSNLDQPHPSEIAELSCLRWVSIGEALVLNLPSITRDILQLLQPFLEHNSLPPVDCPVSFHYSRGKAWQVDILSHPET